jgi:Fur family ferric uptake transcriptional regulator
MPTQPLVEEPRSGVSKPRSDPEPGTRHTRQRAVVAAALGDSDQFVTAQHLHASLLESGERIGLATVYRNLQAMAKAGQADVRRSEDGEIGYRACSPAHHHHLICRNCGRTIEFSDPSLEAQANALAAAHGFTAPDHVVEITGLCPDCS